MNPGFAAAANVWMFALLGLVVLLYFLKLRRPPCPVPSLVLWRRVLDDRRVNAPFQRFKRQLLLWLQLLALLLLILAALQPYWKGGAGRGGRIIVLVDVSASMAALDRPGGRSRLDEAKGRIGELIDGLAGQEICLVSFSRGARRLTDFTDHAGLLRQGLAQLQVEDLPGRLDEALRMAEALGQSGSVERVLLYSDGNFEQGPWQPFPYRLDYQRLGPAGPNLGITRLRALRRPGHQGWEVFAEVAAAAAQGAGGTLEILWDGEVRQTAAVAPGPEAPERLGFEVEALAETQVELRLKPGGFDALGSDDRALLRLLPAEPLATRLAPGLRAFRLALAAIPGLSLVESDALPVRLLISDAEADLARDADLRFFTGLVPPDVRDLIGAGPEGAEVVDWDRASDLLRHVDLDDLGILDGLELRAGAGEAELEARGYEVLVHGRQGPLLLSRRDPERWDYYLLFHADRSTLPYRLAFPILLANLVRQAQQRAGLLEVAGSALLDARETSLAGVEKIELPEQTVKAAGGRPLDRAFWQTLAGLGFFVLLGEWWYYQRRPGGWK